MLSRCLSPSLSPCGKGVTERNPLLRKVLRLIFRTLRASHLHVGLSRDVPLDAVFVPLMSRYLAVLK